MIRIGIYSNNSAHKKEIKKLMIQYFDDLKAETEVSFIRTKNIVLKNLTDMYPEYNIVIYLEEDRVTYIKRKIADYVKNCIGQTVGWLDMPLDNKKLDDIILNEVNCRCPAGTYKLQTRSLIRAVPYCDIEYCQRIKGKTVIFLKNNETEEIAESVKGLKS